jgi:hypothetical protein
VLSTPEYKRRLLRSMQEGEWRPYAEAPRDGTPLLVKFKDRTIVNAAFLAPGFPFLSLLPWDIYGHRLGSQYEDELPMEFRPFLPDEQST